MRNADAAMYIAKRDGKGGYRVFESAMHASVLERLELRAELQRAIDANQFELYFQPLIHLETGSISGIEALCRWHHPTRGLVQPGQFIPLAEEMGLIVEIGRWVLHEGCRQAAEFQACLPPEAAPATRHQPVGQAAAAPRHRGGRPRGARELGTRSRNARPRDHRERDDGRRGARRRAACTSCARSARASRWTTSAPGTRRSAT